MADTAAITTYRYLRISMVGAVLLLAVSIAIERAQVDCWQTSVSAYYYTPVRAIFVGVLMAVGLCLIAIKGSTTWEDATLNAAGMLAPIVAVVPTSDVGTCWSQTPRPLPVNDDGQLADWVVANIDNNITALIVTGIVGLVVGRGDRHDRDQKRQGHRASRPGPDAPRSARRHGLPRRGRGRVRLLGRLQHQGPRSRGRHDVPDARDRGRDQRMATPRRPGATDLLLAVRIDRVL